MLVVRGVGGLIGELHRDPEREAVLRADLADDFERVDAGDRPEPHRGGEEARLLS